MPWILQFSGKNEILEDQLDLFYGFLNKILLQTGKLQAFNDIGEVLLASIDTIGEASSFFFDELKVYLISNMASNLAALGKKAGAIKALNQAEEVMKNDYYMRFSITALKAAFKLAVGQHKESQSILNKGD